MSQESRVSKRPKAAIETSTGAMAEVDIAKNGHVEAPGLECCQLLQLPTGGTSCLNGGLDCRWQSNLE
jgi:hypothetical protein